MSISNGIAASRVSSPASSITPQTISTPLTNGAITSEAGMPILMNRAHAKVIGIKELLDAFQEKDSANHEPDQNRGGWSF